MRYLLVFLLASCSCLHSSGQGPFLKPSIGLSSLPADNSPVCMIPVYQGSYNNSGYFPGDTIPDFTLYSVNGSAMNIATELQNHKPVLLIAGSYTCPVFRQKVADINAMAAFYGPQLGIYVIYTVEAHPSVDPSPYSGNIWVTSQNQTAGILFPQPVTYGQRKAIADTMNAHLTINVPVLPDGPCNEWWSHFGPAPNNAYLVDTNGIIRAKNGWYNRLPDNMWCSIDSLLGTNSGHCIPVANNGNFSFTLRDDSTMSGPAGSVLTIHGMLHNLSQTATATVNIQKAQNNNPAAWLTALCTDVCLSATVSQTQVIIPPADSQSFTFYFYTGTTPAAGNIQVNFTNPNSPGNKAKQKYFATTWPLNVHELSGAGQPVVIYPNPCPGRISLRLEGGMASGALIRLLNIEGRLVKRIIPAMQSENIEIDLSTLDRGIYILNIVGPEMNSSQKVFIY